MCYSARILADYRRYVRMFGATASLGEFVDLFLRRQNDPEARIVIPKGVEAAFADPQSDEERRVKDLIDSFRAQQSSVPAFCTFAGAATTGRHSAASIAAA